MHRYHSIQWIHSREHRRVNSGERQGEQQEEPVGQAWFVRDRVKTGGHPREHWNPQEMSYTQDAGETHALIEDRLTCDSHCGHCQNDLRLDMRDEEKTGGVNAYEPCAP